MGLNSGFKGLNQYLGKYRIPPPPSKRKVYANSKRQIWDVELFDCALPRNLIGRLAKLTAFSPCLFSIFSIAHRPLVGNDVLIIEALRSHWSVGLLWTSGQPDTDTCTFNAQNSQETDIHAPGGIRTLNPSKRAVADPRLRPRGHRDRPVYFEITQMYWWLPPIYYYSWHKQL